MIKSIFLFFIVILTLFASDVYARDYSYMDDHPSGDTRSSAATGNNAILKSVVDATVTATMNSVFSEQEKEVIRRYYRRDEQREPYYFSQDYDYDKKHKKHKKNKKKKSLPPGLRKKVERGGELPPGWQKKVQRGEVMDPEMYYRSQPLPYELRRKLPKQEYGAEIREIENKIVKVMGATGTIIDVFDF